MTHHRPAPARPVLAAALLATLGLATAACGSADGQEAAPLPSSTTAAPATTTTTEAPTTAPPTTLPLTTEAPTTTLAYPTDVAPLTGLPGIDEAVRSRPALAVKIDNHPSAVPQTGLAGADVVFEELVEGISRFAAVFHTNSPGLVGPVRSARTTDIDVLSALGQPLLAWSGGNRGVTTAVRESALVDVGAERQWDGGGYRRNPKRRAPHNLYADTDALFRLALTDEAPAPLFPMGFPSKAATPASGVRYRLEGTTVEFTWDAASHRWLRTQNGRRHVDSDGNQLGATNVVVATTNYRPSPADKRSPEAVTVGSGPVLLLRDGTVTRGTWERPTPQSPWQFVGDDGIGATLSPGTTWVALVPPGEADVLP